MTRDMERWALRGFAIGVLAALAFLLLRSTTASPRDTTLRTVSPSVPSTLVGSCRYQSQMLPDPRCTPGAVNPQVTQATIHSTICVRGWTRTVRPPVGYTNWLKQRDMYLYGDTGSLGLFEEDHRVPLEVGGDPTSPLNLWPQPWASQYGAHVKDVIENRIKIAVCSGRLTLAQGQAVFLGDWWRYRP